LERATPLLRLPTSPDKLPEVLADGSGLRCPTTARVYPYRDGILDLLPDTVSLTETQHVLNTPITSWAYDRFRGALMRVFGLPDFPSEVAAIQQRLQAQPGDTILDLACGHGNFTVEWAKRVGADGLVIGLDIAPAMLARAAAHVREWGLENVLLIRGDAHHLPLADASMPKVNCSGGFHQIPDLPQALREIARISTPGAVLTASTFADGTDERFAELKHWLKRRFALHFVPLTELGEHLAALGYTGYEWSLPGGWFGYATARRSTV
jgi:ubiquinone/menaquinone biosynthesis C-methylase UbiE